jgi:flagellar motility protein MotE (MotC chaperone)
MGTSKKLMVVAGALAFAVAAALPLVAETEEPKAGCGAEKPACSVEKQECGEAKQECATEKPACGSKQEKPAASCGPRKCK